MTCSLWKAKRGLWFLLTLDFDRQTQTNGQKANMLIFRVRWVNPEQTSGWFHLVYCTSLKTTVESFEASHCGAPLVISFRFGHVSPYLCRHHAAGAAAAAAPAAAALVAVDMLSASLVNEVAKWTETQKALASQILNIQFRDLPPQTGHK